MAEPDAGVHLRRGPDQARAVDAVADALGGRVGVDGVLADLDRRARPGRGRAGPVRRFRWDTADQLTRRWFPQGISTSADADPTEEVAGRRVVCVSWYATGRGGRNEGSRLSFVDVTDPARPRYRHVLLVEPVLGPRPGLRPVPVHAGGIVWHRGYLHVAATWRGLVTFRVADILRVPPGGDRSRLRLHGNGQVDAFGYRYVLPLSFRYDAYAADGTDPMRYSFCSLDTTATPHRLVVGEYGRPGAGHRLAAYDLDARSGLLAGDDGPIRPAQWHPGGVRRMQGATVVDGSYHVTTSAGKYRRGTLWVGRPGGLRPRRRVPAGVEDLTYWRSTDRLWSLSEHVLRRTVFSLPRP